MTDLDPTTTALLVMDFQVGIARRIGHVDELLPRVGAVVADVRARGGHVGWVRVAFDDADFDAIPPYSSMARMATPDRRAEMHKDAAATQFEPGLDVRADDVSVRKVRVGAFTTTDLRTQLDGRGVTSLVLAGISTSGVVLSTVREAMDRDYRIIVLSDACADPDPATHDFLTGTLFPRHATVVDAAGLSALWD